MTQINNGRQVIIPLPKDRCLTKVASVYKGGKSWEDWERIAEMYIEDEEFLDGVDLGPGGVQLSFRSKV